MNHNDPNAKKVLEKLLVNLYEYSKKYLNFEEDVRGIDFIDKEVDETKKWSLGVVLGSTGYYDPKRKVIGLYTTNRNIKDILRSFAHELVHHAQFEEENLTDDDMFLASPGYAQKPGKLRSAEEEAYQKGNMMFRDWEDDLKSDEESGNIMLNERKMPWQKSTRGLGDKKRQDIMDVNIDELTREQLSFDVLDACRFQALERLHDPEFMLKFDQMFQTVVGEAFQEIGFMPQFDIPAETYEFANDDILVTFRLFGPYGLNPNPDMKEEDDKTKIILSLEWMEDEHGQKQRGVSEHQYNTIKDAVRSFLKALEKSTTIKMERER